jgi:hypothetical protein
MMHATEVSVPVDKFLRDAAVRTCTDGYAVPTLQRLPKSIDYLLVIGCQVA